MYAKIINSYIVDGISYPYQFYVKLNPYENRRGDFINLCRRLFGAENNGTGGTWRFFKLTNEFLFQFEFQHDAITFKNKFYPVTSSDEWGMNIDWDYNYWDF